AVTAADFTSRQVSLGLEVLDLAGDLYGEVLRVELRDRPDPRFPLHCALPRFGCAEAQRTDGSNSSDHNSIVHSSFYLLFYQARGRPDCSDLIQLDDW